MRDIRRGAVAGWVAGLIVSGPAIGAPGEVSLHLVGSAKLAGAEVVTHDPATGLVFVACEAGIAAVRLDGETGSPEVIEAVTMTRVFTSGFPFEGVTHVEADPLGRGFLLATMVTGRIGEQRGIVAVVDTTGREVVGTVEVGYSPDCVRIHPDGRLAIVANEGEAGQWRGEQRNPPGSISLIELPGAMEAMDQSAIDALGGVELGLVEAMPQDGSVRLHPALRGRPELDLEPEYITVLGDRAFVTLQENNAIAVVNLTEERVERIFGLGSLAQRIDASDKDGINIATTVDTLPMPDQLAAFELGGRGYLVTANEGDDRGTFGEDALGDEVRAAELAERGMLGKSAAESMDLSEQGIGRLKVCAFTGDTDGDGLIDRPHAFGSRSVSVWDGETGELIGDTGSAFEEMIAARWPEAFNANDAGGSLSEPDVRSDDRGPEPEGVVVGEFGERVLAFVSLERPGALAVVEVSDPTSPDVLTITMSALDGHTAPEGMALIRGWGSRKLDLLLVCFEVSGTVAVYEVVVDDGPGAR